MLSKNVACARPALKGIEDAEVSKYQTLTVLTQKRS
jgi:hypothetical protein